MIVSLSGFCGWCDEIVLSQDDPVFIPHIGKTIEQRPYHRPCMVRQILGGVNHLAGRCTCCGGTEPPDPPGLTMRQAAMAAAEYFLTHRWPIDSKPTWESPITACEE